MCKIRIMFSLHWLSLSFLHSVQKNVIFYSFKSCNRKGGEGEAGARVAGEGEGR